MIMKNILLIACIVFCGCATASANLCHEKEYWIEEINKTNSLERNKVKRCLDSDIESQRKTTLVITEVIKNGAAKLKTVSIDAAPTTDKDFNDFYINTILYAVGHNKTIENLTLFNAVADRAFKVAKVMLDNKTIKRLSLDKSDFTDQGALAIADALNVNKSLIWLSMEDSKFSMSSREAIRKAWSANKVEGREEKILF